MDEHAMRSVFRAFDLDHSGGIDLDELQSAVKVLKVFIPPARVAQMFREVDGDRSGEIDYEEFLAILQKGDCGALARVINKMIEDESLRDIVRCRTRPNTLPPSPLEEQLARVREEREWMSSLHMNTVQAQVRAAKSGYQGDTTVYTDQGKGASPSPKPSPVRVTDRLQLSAARSSRCMLPASEEGGAPFEPSPTRGPGLRRLWGASSGVGSLSRSPSHGLISPGLGLHSPSRRRLVAAAQQYPVPDVGHAPPPPGGRSASLPTHRLPLGHVFHEASVPAVGIPS